MYTRRAHTYLANQNMVWLFIYLFSLLNGRDTVIQGGTGIVLASRILESYIVFLFYVKYTYILHFFYGLFVASKKVLYFCAYKTNKSFSFMKIVFSKTIFLCIISLSLFVTSCSNATFLEEHNATHPNTIIKDLKLTSLPSTRGTSVSGKENLVSFTNDATGEEFEYLLRQQSKDNYLAIFETEDDSIKLSMKVQQINEHEWVIEHKYDSLYKVVKITTTPQPNGNTLISLNHNVLNTRSYWVRETWWDCVTNLTLCKESSMLAFVMGSYAPCIAAAASLICLDNRVRKHTYVKNNDNGSIRSL